MKTSIFIALLGVALCTSASWGESVRRASTRQSRTAPQAAVRQVDLVEDTPAGEYHPAESQVRTSYGGDYYGGDYYGGDACCNSCGGGGCDACHGFSCDSGCGNWCDACCDPCGNSRAFGAGQGLVGGGGVMFLKPHWDNNPAYAQGGNPVENVDFDHDLQAAPFAWLGYVGCSGFGVRARWFQFDHSSNVNVDNAINVLAGGPGQPLDFPTIQDLRFQSDLNLDVWDVEATQTVDVGCTTWIGSAGVRYLHVSQHYNVFNDVSDGFLSAHNFNGWGPTISLEGRRNIGCTGLSLYGNARGSILFGDSLYTSFNDIDESADARISSWAPVSIAELEVGAHYSQIVGCSLVYGRVAMVGQHWQGVGNASLSDPTFSGGVDRGNMGLYGVKLELGMNY
jgi:hypothetical protein